MISSDATRDDKFKTSTADPRFDVDAPRTNPLVASSPASVTRMNSGVSIAWEDDGPPETHNADDVFEVAATRARKETLRFPRSARAHANLGIALAKSGKFDDAIEELREALLIDPNHFVAGITLGRILAESGRIGEAKEIYQQLHQLSPSSESVLLSLAYVALREGQFSLAEGYVEESLKANRKRPYSHFLLGITRLERGNAQGAIAALREATRLDVRTGALHHALGVAYAVTGDNVRAERSFRAALAMNPDVIGSVHALCEVLLAQKKPTEVVDLLKPRIENRGAFETRELLARAYIELGRYANARGQLMHVLASEGARLSGSERARLLNNVAVTLLYDGESRAAEAELVKALGIEPDGAEFVYVNLGRLYIGTDRFEDAIDVLKRGRDAHPENQSIRLVLSSAYARTGSFDAAIRELQPFWEGGQAETGTYSMLGWLYEWMDDHATALVVLSEAYRRYPKDPAVVNNLAYSHLMLGNVEEARAVLDSLPKGIQPHVEMVATRGLLHLASGDEAGGLRLYEKAEKTARESGNSDLAKRVRQKLHLELARLAIRQSDLSKAQSEIRKGMLLKPAVYPLDRQFQHLLSELSGAK